MGGGITERLIWSARASNKKLVHIFLFCCLTGSIFTLVSHSDRKTGQHARIIWSCAWSSDDRYFATASRDKKVRVENHEHDYCLLELPCSQMLSRFSVYRVTSNSALVFPTVPSVLCTRRDP